ncbi:hypothetical protein [Haloarcula sediminis]|uniref:hypothetical protein n=1 Tax=Haloarcula sediminis TaxID=3111777 RepID=UPI002D7868A3|nr:hypothetical protein [Haloarcula sp. CK38]
MKTDNQTSEDKIHPQPLQRLLGVLLPDTTVEITWEPSDESPTQSMSAIITSAEFSSAPCVNCPELNQELILTDTDAETIELVPRSDPNRDSIGIVRDVEITELPLQQVPVTESGPQVPDDLVGETGFLDIEYPGHNQQLVIQDGLKAYDERLSGIFEQEVTDIVGVQYVVKMSGCGPSRIIFEHAGDDAQ